jgi:glycosyltransferase involved in cell wall biosynthesis
MKVLISAYACEPGRGSEPGVGWNLVKALSSTMELWVITRANNRQIIEACGEEWIARVHWVYWDPPHWLTFWKKGGRGVQCFYILWQHGVYQVARRLIEKHPIDLCHHVTFGKYWIPSRLASLPVPFVFGPVGGGERTPPSMGGCHRGGGNLAEIGKTVASWIYPRLPWNRRLYHAAAWTFAATEQTAEQLLKLGVRQMSLLPQSGISADELPTYAERNHRQQGPLKLVTACRLIHWKAVDLAIEALALATREIDARLIVLQNGPELENLKSLAMRLGIADRVEFRGRLPGLNDVYQVMAEADALVHPALHEAFGQACLEALALGVPVICLNWAGPGQIVDPSSGFAIQPGTRAETIQRLAAAMVHLNGELAVAKLRATACRKRAYESFHWDAIASEIATKHAAIVSIVSIEPPAKTRQQVLNTK